MLVLMFKIFICYIVCSSKILKTTHQSTVEFFAAIRIRYMCAFRQCEADRKGGRERKGGVGGKRQSVRLLVHAPVLVLYVKFCLFLRLQKKTVVIFRL